MSDETLFPIVIEFTGPHGLGPSAREGIDYYRYALVNSPEELPNNTPFKVIATRVHDLPYSLP